MPKLDPSVPFSVPVVAQLDVTMSESVLFALFISKAAHEIVKEINLLEEAGISDDGVQTMAEAVDKVAYVINTRPRSSVCSLSVD